MFLFILKENLRSQVWQEKSFEPFKIRFEIDEPYFINAYEPFINKTKTNLIEHKLT